MTAVICDLSHTHILRDYSRLGYLPVPKSKRLGIIVAEDFGNTAFAAAGPGLLNSLPPHLTDADLPYSRFRRSLYTFLFG